MENNCKGSIHKVVAGDTLYKISKLYGVRLLDLLKENPYVNVYNLQVGDEICVPVGIYDEEERRYYVANDEETVGTVLGNLGISVDELFEKNKEFYDLQIKKGTIIRM